MRRNNQLTQRKILKIFSRLLGRIKGVVYTAAASPLVRKDTFTDAECLRGGDRKEKLCTEMRRNEGVTEKSVKEIQTCTQTMISMTSQDTNEKFK